MSMFPPYDNINKKILDERYVTRFDPYGPPKEDPYEGLLRQEILREVLPLILASSHQFAGNLSREETSRATLQMYDTAIQHAEYQMDMLKAQIQSLNKQREQLKENIQEG